MPGKVWTKKHDATLLRHYKKLSVSEIAKVLDRSESSVYQRAARLGLSDHRDKVELEKRKRKLKGLIERGLSDSEVALRLNMDRRALTEMRCRMGIVANGRSERYRRRVAEKTRRQCRASGVRNLAELRAKRFEEFVASLGWAGLSVRAAQIAEALHKLGPMTRRQICDVIEMPWRGSRKSLSTNRVPGGSYLAELQRAGIVVRLRAAITHSGKGNREDLYMIGLGVEPCRKTQ
jgi:predicted DNA-binding protein YlxM (UPF0122 family)